MLIKQWPLTDLDQLDHAFGYNDTVITFKMGGVNPVLNDELSGFVFDEALKKPESFPDDPVGILQNKNYLRPDDQVFKLGDHAFIRRRSVFTDPQTLSHAVNAASIIPMSDTMARALAYFSGTHVSPELWFVPRESEKLSGDLFHVHTPWDLKTSAGIGEALRALEGIIAAWGESTEGLAKDVAYAVTSREVADVLKFLKTKQDFVDGQRPFYESTAFHFTGGTAVVGVIFPYVGEIYGHGIAEANKKLIQNILRLIHPKTLVVDLTRTAARTTFGLAKGVAGWATGTKFVLTDMVTGGVFRTAGRALAGGAASTGALFALDGIFDLASSDYEESVHRRVYELVAEEGTGFFLFNWIRGIGHALAPTAYEAAVNNDNGELQEKILAEDREKSLQAKQGIKTVLQSLLEQNIPLNNIESGLTREYPFEWNSVTHDTLVLSDPIAAKKEYEYSDDELEAKVERALFEGIQEQIKILRFIDQPLNDWARSYFLTDGRLKSNGMEGLSTELGLFGSKQSVKINDARDIWHLRRERGQVIKHKINQGLTYRRMQQTSMARSQMPSMHRLMARV